MSYVYFESLKSDGSLESHTVAMERVHIRELESDEAEAVARLANKTGNDLGLDEIRGGHASAKSVVEVATPGRHRHENQKFFIPITAREATANLAVSSGAVHVINGDPQIEPTPQPATRRAPDSKLDSCRL